jgi:hypothetical protein
MTNILRPIEQGIESISLNPDSIVETWRRLASPTAASVRPPAALDRESTA